MIQALRCLTAKADRGCVSAGRATYCSRMVASDKGVAAWTLEAAERWLSHQRLQRYLQPAANDLDLAMRLYQWNASTSAAAMVEVAHLEVAMRNAYTRRLSITYPDWLDQSSRLWTRRIGNSARQSDQRRANELTVTRLEQAKRGVRHVATPDRIIANTTFGLWCHLTDPHREPTLWTPIISGAYPAATKRGAVHRMAMNVMAFRNRIAHHEPLFTNTTAFSARVREVRLLHALLDSFSADRMYNDQLGNLVVGCPVPGLLQWPEPLSRRPSGLLGNSRPKRGNVPRS